MNPMFFILAIWIVCDCVLDLFNLYSDHIVLQTAFASIGLCIACVALGMFGSYLLNLI